MSTFAPVTIDAFAETPSTAPGHHGSLVPSSNPGLGIAGANPRNVGFRIVLFPPYSQSGSTGSQSSDPSQSNASTRAYPKIPLIAPDTSTVKSSRLSEGRRSSGSHSNIGTVGSTAE